MSLIFLQLITVNSTLLCEKCLKKFQNFKKAKNFPPPCSFLKSGTKSLRSFLRDEKTTVMLLWNFHEFVWKFSVHIFSLLYQNCSGSLNSVIRSGNNIYFARQASSSYGNCMRHTSFKKVLLLFLLIKY